MIIICNYYHVGNTVTDPLIQLAKSIVLQIYDTILIMTTHFSSHAATFMPTSQEESIGSRQTRSIDNYPDGAQKLKLVMAETEKLIDQEDEKRCRNTMVATPPAPSSLSSDHETIKSHSQTSISQSRCYGTEQHEVPVAVSCTQESINRHSSESEESRSADATFCFLPTQGQGDKSTSMHIIRQAESDEKSEHVQQIPHSHDCQIMDICQMCTKLR